MAILVLLNGPPADAGLAARALAISMAQTHLAAGHDVVVPQFLARVGFIEEQSFSERSRAPSTQSHVDAAGLVGRSGSPDAVADMYDAFSAMLETRPSACRGNVEIGDIDGTLGRLERAINQD